MKLKAKILVKNRKLWWPYNVNESVETLIDNVLTYTKTPVGAKSRPKLYYQDAELPVHQLLGDHFDEHSVNPELELRFDKVENTNERIQRGSESCREDSYNDGTYKSQIDAIWREHGILEPSNDPAEEEKRRFQPQELQEKTDRYLRLFDKDPDIFSDSESRPVVEEQLMKGQIGKMPNRGKAVTKDNDSKKLTAPGIRDRSDRLASPPAPANAPILPKSLSEELGAPEKGDSSVIDFEARTLASTEQQSEAQDPRYEALIGSHKSQNESHKLQHESHSSHESLSGSGEPVSTLNTFSDPSSSLGLAAHLTPVSNLDDLPSSFGSTARSFVSHVPPQSERQNPLPAPAPPPHSKKSDKKWKEKLILRVVECNGTQQPPIGPPDKRFSIVEKDTNEIPK